MIDARHCGKCGETKSIDEFYPSSFYQCKECTKKATREYHHKNKDRESYNRIKRNTYYKRVYGMTLDERDALYQKQDGKCKICLTKLEQMGTHTHVDHNHTTGKVRGILCTNCNRGLGHFQDNADILQAAKRYLDLDGDT